MLGVSVIIIGSLILSPSLNSYYQYKAPDFNIEGKCMPPIVEPWMITVLTILQEASSESLEGMTAVAEVIRDRTKTKFHSDGSLINTILAPSQFSGWNDSNRIRVLGYDISDPEVTMAIKAYKNAFEHNTNYALGANLYHADWMNPYPDWTNSPKVKRLGHIGKHIFYFEER